MKKKFFTTVKYLSLLAFGLFLFWLAFRNQDYHRIIGELSNIHYFYIGLAFIAAIASFWIRAIRWNLLIKPLGHHVSGKNSFMAVLVGYFANMALPRMGEVTRCVVLNRTNKVPIDKLIGTVIIERLIDFLTLMILVVITVLVEFDKLNDFFVKNLVHVLESKTGETGKLLTFSHVVMAVSFIVIIIAGVWLFYRRFRHLSFVLKILKFINGFIDGMKSVWKMKQRWLFLYHTFLLWLMYYLMVYFCFFALDFSSSLGVRVALSVLVMGSFGFVVPVQGGIGAYHAVVSQTLRLYGLSAEEGLTWAFVAHTFQMVTTLVVGGIAFLIFTVSFRKKKHEDLSGVSEEKALQP